MLKKYYSTEGGNKGDQSVLRPTVKDCIQRAGGIPGTPHVRENKEKIKSNANNTKRGHCDRDTNPPP